MTKPPALFAGGGQKSPARRRIARRARMRRVAPRLLYRLKAFASFSVSRARIIASRPTAVKVVPHSM